MYGKNQVEKSLLSEKGNFFFVQIQNHFPFQTANNQQNGNH